MSASFEAIISGIDDPVPPAAANQTPPPAQAKPTATPPPSTEKPAVVPPKAEDDFSIDPLKPTEKKPDAVPPANDDETPGKPGRRSNDAIRAELKRIAAEKEEALKSSTELAERVKTYEEDLKKIREEREQLAERLKAAEITQTMGDPQNHPKIREISEPFNQKVKNFAEDYALVAGAESAPVFSAIINASKQFADVSPEDPDAAKKIAAISRGLADQFDDQQTAREAIRLMREGAVKISEIRSTVAEIKNDFPTFQYKQQSEIYNRALAEYSELERTFFDPPTDVEAADPLNVGVILKGMIKSSDEVKNAADSVKNFARMVLLPPPPIPVDDGTGIDDTARNQKLIESQNRHLAAQKKLRSILAEAILARAVLPSVFKQLNDLTEVASGERRVVRPRLNGDQRAAAAATQEPETVDIRDFKPVNDKWDEFKKSS